MADGNGEQREHGDGESGGRRGDGKGGGRAKLVIVGGGPGGYLAAFTAAELGSDVTLVDPEERPGGVCLYRGCIPSKALLHAAKLVRDAEEGATIGISFGKPEIDVDRVRTWKDEVVGKLTGGLGMKVKRMKVDHVRGRGRLTGEHSLEVALLDGSTRALEFDQAILATGSRPVPLPGAPENSDRILDSSSALDLPSIPKSLLVVGGGYIGLELGSVYAALGSQVTVVEMTQGLLPGVDRDLVSVLKRRLDTQFEEIRLDTRITALEEQKDGVRVTLEDKKGGTENRAFERVLVSIGRRPNSEDLGLEAAGIETDERGFVKVDGQRRTTARHIFAIGDLAGEPMLAHKAYAEALVAAEAAAGRKAVYDPRAIPAVVFTDPEIAWCGLTETEARAQKRPIETAKVPWRSNGRTLTLGRDDGLTKLIADPETGRLLGVGLAGPGAGELIAEAVLAVEMAAVGEDLRRTIHPHPTLSETLFDAAASLRG
jgi:dihydrolipoamide dehydrogenase